MSKSILVAVRTRVAQQISWRRILSAVVLVLSLVYLGYSAYSSWDALKAYDWQIQAVYLIPSFLLFLVQLLVIVWGWQSIMNCIAQPLPFGEHLKIYAYTNLLRRIPAGVVWMFAGRMYAYRNENVSARTAAVGTFLEFLLSILAGLPLAAVAGAGLGLYSPVVGVFLAMVSLLLELGVTHPSILNRLLRLMRHKTLGEELIWKHTLFLALLHTLIWLISGTGLFIIARLFTNIPINNLPTTIGIWVLSTLFAYLIMFSPSGLGVKELSLTFLLGMILPAPFPLLIALAIRVLWTLYDAVLGLLAWIL